MPATRPRASFEPIPPDLDLHALVEQTENFQFVDRISCDMIDQNGMDKFDKLVLLHVIIGGKPLVIDGYHMRLDPWTFSSRWLQDNHGEKVEGARDLSSQSNISLSVGHYLRSMGQLADQYFSRPGNYKDKKRQRVYLKDIDCPEVWQDKVREQLPPNLFYWNDCTGVVGGPGASDEPAPDGGKRKGRGIAPAGDLMSSLPEKMRAENLMCYIGHEGTYTPAHREMCASLGHNIMVECSEGLGDDGKPQHTGSSIWFMTETKDRHSVAEYWLSKLGHDVEVEKHFAQIAAWKKAPFTVYIVDQRPGDFILIPPLAPHQVWNRGTRTMKVAWNRTTVETLEMALEEALPNSRIVCRDEQYKNKAIIYFTLQKYSALLTKLQDLLQTAPRPQEVEVLRKNSRIRALQKDFKRLFKLYQRVLLSEAFKPGSEERGVQLEPFESTVICSYCRGNIFNRFLTCTSCKFYFNPSEEEPYDICMECFAMGRSCGCISKLSWVEQFKWKELTSKYEQFQKQYLQLDGTGKPDSPLPFQQELARTDKKMLAQVCQEQLRRRPWKDVMNPAPEPETESDEETQVNEDGTAKKTKRKRSETWQKNHWSCHVCRHRHEKWKMAECKCGRRYCYGTLFRGHDLMPQTVMEALEWTCPHCRGTCSSGQCVRLPDQNPHQPKGTLLGHNTKAVADPRSVESLVDFSVSNLHYLNESSKEPASDIRLLQRQQEAEAAKADDGTMLDPYATDDEIAMESQQPEEQQPVETPPARPSNGWTATNSQIDPMLLRDTSVPQAVPVDTTQMDNDQDFDEDDDAEMASILQIGSTNARLGTGQQPKKRGAPSEDRAVSNATKQYRKEQERQALDTARKQGRWIMANAALKGMTRLVKLSVTPSALRDTVLKNKAQQQAQAALGDVTHRVTMTPRSIIKSDIVPPENTKSKEKPKEQSPKQVRFRYEKDEDFSTRKRRRKGAANALAQTHGDFEDIDLTGEEDDDTQTTLTSGIENTNGSKKRRISAWQAQHRAEEDHDIPDQLPDDYKDRRVRTTASKPPQEEQTDQEQATEATAQANEDTSMAAPLEAPPNSSPAQVTEPASIQAEPSLSKAASKAPALRPFTGGKSTAQIRPAISESNRGTIEDASSDSSDNDDDSDIHAVPMPEEASGDTNGNANENNAEAIVV